MLTPSGAVIAFVGSFLASAANAHMIMSHPVPYGVSTLNNSPLGNDYPCKQRAGMYDITEMNNIQVGEPQTLSFNGTAGHGGGTCQVSVSLDKNPTASSVFKVVHSIEGDCPGPISLPDTFQFALPKGFPNGEYALAWTWFNRVGNREMYMNCAPITVTGGADNNDVFDQLPDMQIANIPSTTCRSVENTVPILPNPGYSLERHGVGPFENMTGDCGYHSSPLPAMGHQPSMGQEPDEPQANSSAVAAPIPPQASSTDPCDPCAHLPKSFTTSTIPTSSAETLAATPTVLPLPVNPPNPLDSPAPVDSPAPINAPVPTDTPSAPIATPATAPLGFNSTMGIDTCSSDGAMLCNGLTQFGICNFGKVVWQPVAPGTQCKDGQIGLAERSRIKRYLRFARRRGQHGVNYHHYY